MNTIIVATIRDRHDHQVGSIEATTTGTDLLLRASDVLPITLNPLRAATITLCLDGTLAITGSSPNGDLADALESLSNKRFRLVYDATGVDQAQQMQAALYKAQPHDCFAAGLAHLSRTS
jgi:hypothetical protein